MESRARRWPSDHQARFAASKCYIGVHERTQSPRDMPGGFATANDGHSCAVIDGRLHNRAELQHALSIRGNDASLILAAYKRWGKDFAARLVGEFTLAVADPGRACLELVRDAMGTRPLFTSEGGGYYAFASSMDALLALPFVDRAEDRLWISDFLEIVKPDSGSTPYKGIAAVPPATRISKLAHFENRDKIWAPPTTGSLDTISLDDAVAEYRHLFDQAVACRVPASGSVASELSGGLDSTSIAVTAAPVIAARGDIMLTLSHVLNEPTCGDAPLSDERVEIEAVLDAMPVGKHYWLANSAVPQVSALADTIARHGGLHRRDFNSLQLGVAEAMRENDCRVLLSGFGGDQLATSQGAGLVESLAREARWEDLARLVASPLARLAWRTPVGRTLLHWRARRAFELRCRKAPRLTRPTLLSDDELARRRMRFPLRPYWGTIGARERSVISSPHIGHRAQDSAVGAGSLGFEYAYPMLDLRLVEFCLRLPDRLKLHPGGQRRTLIRSAMSGRLPDRVRLRDDKSWASVPFAISRFFAEAGDFMALFERHRSDPAVAAFVDMDFVIDELRQSAASAGSVGQLSVRQFHRIAQFCLWQEFQKSASALSG